MMRYKLDQQKGQALVEFALMLPFLLFILMAIFDFSRIMFVYALISNSAREGARFGSVVGNDTENPRYLNCEAIKAAVQDTLILGMTIDEIKIEYDNGNDSVLFTCGSPGEINEGDRIRVTVTTSVNFLTPGMSSIFLFPNGLPIQFSSARTIWSEGIFVGVPSS